MNSNDLQNLSEAYSQVQLDQVQLDEAGKNDARIRGNIKSFGSNYTPPRDWDQSANRGQGAVLNAKQKEKQRRKGLAKSAMGEAVDIYDIILSHLLDEGYADTEQAAEAIMVNMSEDWRESIVESIAGRAANAVGHQRAGTLGDDDEIRKNQDSTSASIGKMKRGSGAKVTPTLPGV